jgi:endonuclease YncB( thermonuclease family)
MRAKAKASELAFGKLIELTAAGHDRYGRTIGYVQLPDGSDFGTEMIRSGLAWRYVAYSKNELLSNVENEARRQRLGLWSDPGVVAPWTYRKTRHPRRAKVH